ncbi:hypothetical protein ACFOUP_18975 [Belliella kenyensis]|uniref:Cas10/Cmr2 second palm domain-containing protein n=1 Tax=Belliella kenyensis TaxID=1472724 RepID=A0ABV8EQZ9_9BACT|nr:hypothetical protein [Belliella kenyensis]MCH7402139.1 hypothetical protein [Belliella kenyensis]MDN3601654.1 hypothetical protein [Belliella kenyensis]
MSKYLYGASIQGIQSFIFQTNKLKEIVGGSELVDYLSSTFFKEFLEENGISFHEGDLILSAAGNIKYEFNKADDCQKVVKGFSKKAMLKAPGITVSQATVTLDDFETYGKALQALEDRLRIQRNKANYILGDYNPFKIGASARRTGGLGVKYEKDEIIDLGQLNKHKRAAISESKLMEVLTGRKKATAIRDNSELAVEWGDFTSGNNWLGIIHADGNGLGAHIMSIYSKIEGDGIKEVIREFSKTLDLATKQSVREAYQEIFGNDSKSESYEPPIRPILLGGDDITVIIKGDAAIPFANVFLKKFEANTKSMFLELEKRLKIEDKNLGLSKGLTACAGVSFVKPNFPFHYGVHLSESLTAAAKTSSKSNLIEGKIPSSAIFHKVQSSFVEDYSAIVDQMLDHGHIRFDFGPYFIDKNNSYSTIDELLFWIKTIKRPSAPRAGLRQWLGVIPHDPTQAKFMFDRIRQNLKERNYQNIISDLHLENEYPFMRDKKTYTHLYDVVNLSSL